MKPAAEDLLAIYPQLADLRPAARQQLFDQLSLIELPAGTRVFDEHDPCRGFPFVLDGGIRVLKNAPNGRELPLYRVEAGETCVISSACLLGGAAYNARGITDAPTRLAVLPASSMFALLAEEPFRRFVFNLFSERVAQLMQLVEEVAFRKLDQRLASRLLGHGQVLTLTHQQLADELGSVREIVSRLLKGFEQQQLVRLGRGHIEVLDAAGLRRLAAG
ncbi:MAG: Crp/Fnr family transcriptional regulator [Rhodocyclaceae bacterium]|nr:Crp/Fnr family transcriptional regulator [Rhodocyclaceae bacterium]MBX3667132.1 Crp/Fnr family transcriptional regulator [Rhodocyclaceae bacterium]